MKTLIFTLLLFLFSACYTEVHDSRTIDYKVMYEFYSVGHPYSVTLNMAGNKSYSFTCSYDTIVKTVMWSGDRPHAKVKGRENASYRANIKIDSINVHRMVWSAKKEEVEISYGYLP